MLVLATASLLAGFDTGYFTGGGGGGGWRGESQCPPPPLYQTLTMYIGTLSSVFMTVGQFF